MKHFWSGQSAVTCVAFAAQMSSATSHSFLCTFVDLLPCGWSAVVYDESLNGPGHSHGTRVNALHAVLPSPRRRSPPSTKLGCSSTSTSLCMCSSCETVVRTFSSTCRCCHRLVLLLSLPLAVVATACGSLGHPCCLVGHRARLTMIQWAARTSR